MDHGRQPETVQARPLRTIFFGTPDFAVPILERLVAEPGFDVVLVVTQPDRPSGRGRKPTPSQVKLVAELLQLSLYQPPTLRAAEDRAPLLAAQADLFVVAAFGLIFGRKTLAIPRLGCVNVHASLLPRYRGAAPIPAAILNGDAETGVTLMRMEPGLDTGPMLAAAPVAIQPQDTAATLTKRLSTVGATLAAEAIPAYAAGALVPAPQPDTGATLVRPLVKADGWLDWNQRAASLERRVRAMWPWPRAWTTLADAPLQVHAASVAELPVAGEPGSVLGASPGLVVACGTAALSLDVVQPAGGRPMSGAALLAGRRVRPGDRLGLVGAPPPPPPLVVPVMGGA